MVVNGPRAQRSASPVGVAMTVVGSQMQSRGVEQDERYREGDEGSGQLGNRTRYVLFPATSLATRSRTSPPLGRTPQDDDAAALASLERVTKRNRSVKNLLSTPALFKRKNALASVPRDRRPEISPPVALPFGTPRSRTIDSTDAPSSGPLLPSAAAFSGRSFGHERSNSAPSWRRKGSLDDVMTMTPPRSGSPYSKPSGHRWTPSNVDQSSVAVRRKPVAARTLEKLVIPTVDGEPWRVRTPRLEASDAKLSSPLPPDPPPKETPRDDSPRVRGMVTPSTRSSVSLASNGGMGAPVTAPEADLHRRPWETTTEEGQSHQRLASDGSVMDRGRPRKRRNGEGSRRGKTWRKNRSPEGMGDDPLPTGFKVAEAPHRFGDEDTARLYQQALGQVARFEVIGVKDVESLSKVRIYARLCFALGFYLPTRLHPSMLANVRGLNCMLRSYEPWMNVASTCARRSNRCVRADKHCIRAQWHISGLPDWPNCRVRACSVKHGLWPIWMPPLTIGSGSLNEPRTVENGSDRNCLSMSLQR